MNKHITILAVESIEDIQRSILQTFHLSHSIEETVIFGDVGTAIAYLRKEDAFVNAKTPALILLDLDTQEKQGIELLSYIKNDRKFKVIPVIIIGTSLTKNLLSDCYQNHVNCIIAKPGDPEKFSQVIEIIRDFWINITELPNIKNES